MKKNNKDIVGEKSISGNSGKLAYSDGKRKKTWKKHYKELLNVEFPWWEEDLSEADPILGTTPVISQAMVEKSIIKIKKGKAPSPSGAVTDKLKASSDACFKTILDLPNFNFS